MKSTIDTSFFQRILNMPLAWAADPTEFLCLRAQFEDRWLQIRINPKFPDGPAYRFTLDEGFIEFDDFPSTWKRGPLQWPESAKR